MDTTLICALVQSAPDTHSSGLGTPFAIIVFLCAAVLYFAPSVVAYRKHATAAPGILITNVVFGWTILGWFIALIWAASVAAQPHPQAELPSQPAQ